MLVSLSVVQTVRLLLMSFIYRAFKKTRMFSSFTVSKIIRQDLENGVFVLKTEWSMECNSKGKPFMVKYDEKYNNNISKENQITIIANFPSQNMLCNINSVF